MAKPFFFHRIDRRDYRQVLHLTLQSVEEACGALVLRGRYNAMEGTSKRRSRCDTWLRRESNGGARPTCCKPSRTARLEWDRWPVTNTCATWHKPAYVGMARCAGWRSAFVICRCKRNGRTGRSISSCSASRTRTAASVAVTSTVRSRG